MTAELEEILLNSLLWPCSRVWLLVQSPASSRSSAQTATFPQAAPSIDLLKFVPEDYRANKTVWYVEIRD